MAHNMWRKLEADVGRKEELIIAWNGPEIPHSDPLIKDTIDRMHGAGNWHSTQASFQKNKNLKFYRMSKSVDREQNKPSYYFDKY